MSDLPKIPVVGVRQTKCVGLEASRSLPVVAVGSDGSPRGNSTTSHTVMPVGMLEDRSPEFRDSTEFGRLTFSDAMRARDEVLLFGLGDHSRRMRWLRVTLWSAAFRKEPVFRSATRHAAASGAG